MDINIHVNNEILEVQEMIQRLKNKQDELLDLGDREDKEVIHFFLHELSKMIDMGESLEKEFENELEKQLEFQP